MENIGLCPLNDILKEMFPSVNSEIMNYYNILYDISIAIFDKRTELGMTQQQLADTLGVSKETIKKYESGDYNFDLRTLCKISDKLGIVPVLTFDNKENNFKEEKI